MATLFTPAPTYAPPVLVSEDGKAVFNPIWLSWFLEIAQFISASGGGGGGGGLHNSLGGLQGGTSNEYYHLTSAQLTALVNNILANPALFTKLTASSDVTIGGTLKFGTYTAGLIAQAGSVSIVDSGGTTRRLLVG